MRISRLIQVLAMLLLVLADVPQRATAQPAGTQPGAGQPRYYAFNETDFIRSTIDLARMRRSYFVGQPVPVPLVLSNHTRFPITIETNFVPTSRLHVTIQLVNEKGEPMGREKVYAGPYLPEIYGGINIPLRPMDSVTQNVHLWGDRDTTTGLLFDTPGQFRVRIEQQASVLEGGPALRGLRLSYPEFTIEVTPTPQALVPLIQTLIERRGFPSLHLGKLPAGLQAAEAEALAKTTEASPLTPFLYRAVGAQYHLQYLDNKEDKGALDRALINYQIASLSESAIQTDILLDLLKLFDEIELPDAAAKTAVRALQSVPESRRGSLGSNELMQKYLGLNEDIEPMAHWTLMP